jgi:hypothetical protein
MAYQMAVATRPRERSLTLRGSREPEPPLSALQVGSLEAFVQAADLRHVRCGGVELLRQVYVAVRDPSWRTLRPESLEVDTTIEETAARLSWRALYDEQDIALAAHGTYELRADGTLIASFRAEAHSCFRYNRIGLCLLHPPAEFAGQPFRADGVAGTVRGLLPERIGAQPIVDGLPAPLFPAVSRLELEGRSGSVVRLEFEGDVFEVEDQRNWTDDSFKIYSTPLALGFPHEARVAQRFEQRVAISVQAAPPARRRAQRKAVSLRLGETLGADLPRIGLGAPSHDEPLSSRAGELLRAVNPRHLRVVLADDYDAAEQVVERTNAIVAALRTDIQLVLVLAHDPEPQLDWLPGLLARLTQHVPDLLVLAAGDAATAGSTIGPVRQRLSSVLMSTRFHGGTDRSFCELNREPLDTEGLDGVAYAIHPQEHAFDDASLFETLSVQGETVRSARWLYPRLSLLVGPVTLAGRSSDANTRRDAGLRQLPSHVDPRQLSLLAAAWTAGSLKYLAEARADTVTYYETTGWCGLIETEAGPPLPDLFPSRPGEAFPLYHVLADVAGLRGAVLAVESDEPLAAVAIAAEANGDVGAIVANLRPESTDVELSPFPNGPRRIRSLNAESAELAAAEPHRFRKQWRELPAGASGVRLRLEPYEVATVEGS